MPLRTAEPPTLRLTAWHSLEALAHKAPTPFPPSSHLSAWRVKRLGEIKRRDGVGGSSSAVSPHPPKTPKTPPADALLDAMELSVRRGNLRDAPPQSFLFRFAAHHLSAAAFGGGGTPGEGTPGLLRRLLNAAPEAFLVALLRCEPLEQVPLAALTAAEATAAEAATPLAPSVRVELGRVLEAEHELLARLREEAPVVVEMWQLRETAEGVLV